MPNLSTKQIILNFIDAKAPGESFTTQDVCDLVGRNATVTGVANILRQSHDLESIRTWNHTAGRLWVKI